MDAGRARPGNRGIALAVAACAGLLVNGCGQSKYMDLPDLATQSPTKQHVMTPTDQRKAIDELIAKRDKQAAEAKQNDAEKTAK